MKGGFLEMGKLNRGNVTKLSIRLTGNASKEIQRLSMILNLSQAGVILHSLSKILKEKPDMHELLNLEAKYDLAPKNFALTIKREVADRINDMNVTLDMNKNIWVGLLVSDYFEKRHEQHIKDQVPPEELDRIEEELAKDEPVIKTDTTQVKIEINTELKKKIVEFSEKNYIALSGLVAYSLLNGPYEDIPEYRSGGKEDFFTNIPVYLYEDIKKKTKGLYPKEGFYYELCLYNAFMGEDPVFKL